MYPLPIDSNFHMEEIFICYASFMKTEEVQFIDFVSKRLLGFVSFF